jgi:hypothetical protein
MVFGRFKNYAAELVNRFRDEMSAKIVFTLDASKASYFGSSTPLFGIDVFDNFPSANEDIAEAGNCLALARGTACVMHLMRVLEVGLSALAKALGVNKQNDWGSYIREIDRVLSERRKNEKSRSAEEQFVAEAAIIFDHLKRAWRNPTMHVDRSYSPERADEIFQAVKSFMRHLATRLTE